MNNQTEQSDGGVFPYFFNTDGNLCPKRLSSMVLMLIVWFAALYYCFGNEPWQGMPRLVILLMLAGCLPEIQFVLEQAGQKPKWGGLDPLGWATDYNGHPSTHRVKSIVSTAVGCIVILADAFNADPSPGRKAVAVFFIVVPSVLGFVIEPIERRGTVRRNKRPVKEN